MSQANPLPDPEEGEAPEDQPESSPLDRAPLFKQNLFVFPHVSWLAEACLPAEREKVLAMLRGEGGVLPIEKSRKLGKFFVE